ncbi:MAG: hypothetical protein ACKV2V_30025 [Blastocatellia bacterium]
MKRIIIFACLMIIAVSGIAQTAKPDYSGTWKRTIVLDEQGRRNQNPGDTMTIVHTEPDIQVRLLLKEAAGERTLEMKGKTDGKDYELKADVRPASFSARWDAGKLILTVRHNTANGPVQTRRQMWLMGEGKNLGSLAVQTDKSGVALSRLNERWEKQ